MRKIALIFVATTALSSTSVLAADMAPRPYTKAPVYVAPVYNWTGFYIGGHVGAAFGDNSFNSTVIPAFVTNGDDARFMGGGQIGFDYQFGQNWLIGIEGQISAIDNGNRGFSNGVVFVNNSSDWLASVTGRLGYTWGPGLIYAKGGVAFRDNGGAGVFFVGGPAFGFVNREDTGYTVGGGLEYLFAPSWSAKVEYQYYNFDNAEVFATGATVPFGNFREDIHTVKLGINYRFNWGSPVVAKY